MLLTTIGFFIAGAVIVGALARFWDDIKNWLNTVAADAVEAHLGYSARNNMQKAVAIVDRILNVVKNKSIIYTKIIRLIHILIKQQSHARPKCQISMMISFKKSRRMVIM